MSKRSTSKFVLTDRDHKILYFLFRFKIVTIENIQRQFFSKVQYSVVTRRFRKLEKLKLVKRSAIYTKDRKTISLFTLTPLGLTKLKINGQIVTRNQIKSNYPEHDLELVKIIEVISKFTMVKQVITENELLSFDLFQNDAALSEFIDLKPDMVLKLNIKGNPFNVAFEYELHAKSASRWKQKLTNYYKSDSIDAVFYLCECSSLMNKLIAVDREIVTTEKRKIFFCLAQNINSQDQKVTLTNSLDAEFILNWPVA